jgi:hypothetical protein
VFSVRYTTETTISHLEVVVIAKKEETVTGQKAK